MAQIVMSPRLLGAALLLSAAAVQAQDAGLPDPTRPPATLSGAVRAPGQAAASADGPQLQSILVSLRPGGRRVAVIDGKTVRQGERSGEAIVETIRSTEVVLRTGNQRQILKLFRPVAPVATASP